MSEPVANEPVESAQDDVDDLLLRNARRFTAVAEYFDKHRPTPPSEITAVIQKLNPRLVPSFVVDLGCGVGLSMEPWLDRAKVLVGVDPNGEMLTRAQRRMARYRGSTVTALQHAYSDSTGVGDQTVDVVTCSQSLHWMEPETTFNEIHRILKTGGVMAAYDCDWPPTSSWEVSYAWKELLRNVEVAEAKLKDSELVQHWTTESQFGYMENAGIFRFTTETVLHHSEPADADRHLGLALSLPRVQNLFAHGIREREVGLFDFYRTIDDILAQKKREINFCYRIHLGVK